MQDMHAIGDGGGGGGGGRFIGVGDRRLRPHNHQALKCPRCDSLNTKFCYYNNYNLSQPRHYCKSCRRYWTKGGVLRSVPVGGGCRKNKRSKAKNTASDAPRESKSNAQSSSSESSSLTAAAAATASASATATTPTSAGTAAAEEGSAPSYTTSDSSIFYNFPDARFSDVNPRSNSNFDHQPLVNHSSTDGQIFSTEMGSFTTLMTSSEEMMGFGIADISYGRDQSVNHALVAEDPSPATADEFKIEDMSNEALQWGSSGGRGGGDQDLFDLTAEVDPSYWNQSEWNVDDQAL